MFPKIITYNEKLRENIQKMLELCSNYGITITGVVKGTNGHERIVEQFLSVGAESIGSSRLSQLKTVKSLDAKKHTLMLRIPMLSELEEMVQCADCSLQSELATIQKTQEICQHLNIRHEVLIMVDLGDLREGFFDEEEACAAAEFIEWNCSHLTLKGIGTNLGCYGSIVPDQQNLGKLVSLAKRIEKTIKRRLEWVSGGATTSIPLVLNGSIPEGVTHLRIGDGIFLRDMELYFDYTFDEMHEDVFELQAEVIELHEKPSFPIGTISVDAFGNTPEYEDKGIRKRALLAVGRQDIGDMTKLIPYDSTIQIIGGSSDHTIIDVTDASQVLNIGDKVSFRLQYENLVYAFNSEYITKEFVE